MNAGELSQSVSLPPQFEQRKRSLISGTAPWPASIGACSTDWVSWYAPSIANKESAPEVMWEYFGGAPWDRLEVYNRHSTRAFLKNIKTPSIVLHGAEDIDSGPEVYVALRDLGVPVSYVTYPREGHGISEPMHQIDLMRRNLEWFKKWIPER